MSLRRTYFEDERTRLWFVAKAREMGVPISVDTDNWFVFDDDQGDHCADPHIAALDDVFGLDWVAVYADSPIQRAERANWLERQGISFVIWHDDAMGVSIVIHRRECPADWEYA